LADGNCLFNASSLHIAKNDKLAPYLRLLTSLELYLHPEYYVHHQVFYNSVRHGFQTPTSAFYVSLKEKVIQNIKAHTSMKVEPKDMVKVMAADICIQHTYVSFIAVVALCNVISAPIHIYTSSLQDKRLLGLFNQVIFPSNTSNSEPMFLFWTSTKGSDHQLDHFVPLFDLKYLGSETTISKPTEVIKSLPDQKLLKDIFTAIGFERKGIITPARVIKKRDASKKWKKHGSNLENKKIKLSEVTNIQSFFKTPMQQISKVGCLYSY